MDRYIGLDVHAQSSTLAVLGPSGKRLTNVVVETNEAMLVKALNAIPGKLHLCLEEGTQSAWLHEVLSPHVEELVVVVAEASGGQKSDQRDAWGLAELIRMGAVKTKVYKAPAQFGRLRAAMRGYGMLTDDIARTKNRLKAVYRSRGVLTGTEIYRTDSREPWLQKLPDSNQLLATLLGQQLDAMTPLKKFAEQQLEEEASKHRATKILQTVPGLGLIRSALVVAKVIDPARFRTKRQFWSYAGLGIVTRSSADWVRQGGKWVRAQTTTTRGLTRKRQPLLKAAFKGAATTVISEKMAHHPWHKDYERMLEAGVKPNLAKLTLARRISATALAMWKHQEVYDPGKHRHA